MRYSVIIPVYNRPDEVDELLQSLTRQCRRPLSGHSEHPLLLQAQFRPGANTQLWRRTQPGRIPDNTGLRLHPSRRLLSGSGKRITGNSCRRLWRTRPRTCLFYRCAKSHQLLHDFILHHRRYSRREKENGQVLSEELQYGSTPRGLRSTRRLLPDAFWRRHRFQHPHLQRRIQVQAVSRSMGISQTTDGPEEILQASAQFRHCPHQPLQETSRLLENRASAARHIHTGSSGATGRRTFLPIQPPTGCAICTARLHRLRHSKQEPAHRPLFHCCILHPAHRIWNRILESLVEPLHTRQR